MKKIGLIAGNGRFPFLVAQEIKKRGESPVCFAIEEEAEPGLEKFCDAYFPIRLGQFQKLIDLMHGEKVDTALMAGQVKHTQIFKDLKPDLRAVKLLAKLLNKKTDTILGAIVREFSQEKIEFLPSHKYLKHLMAKKGVMSGEKPGAAQKADIEFGLSIAKNIAGLDIGQSVVVKDRSVIAVESIEGTDECIRRAYKYVGDGIVVIKIAKPGQDWRFDIPVIGPKTIETMSQSGSRLLAVEADATLILEKEEVMRKAAENDITIIGI